MLIVPETFAMRLAALTTGALVLLIGVQVVATGLIGEMPAASSPRQTHAARATLRLHRVPTQVSTRPPSLSQIP